MSEQIPTMVAPNQAEESADSRRNPVLAENMAYAEKPDRDRAHELGKMVTEVQVTPENAGDENEYIRQRLDPVESSKDYSGSLIAAKADAERAAGVKSMEVRDEYARELAKKQAGIN